MTNDVMIDWVKCKFPIIFSHSLDSVAFQNLRNARIVDFLRLYSNILSLGLLVPIMSKFSHLGNLAAC